MDHCDIDDEIRGKAALYALGALPPDEALSFSEHLDKGCEAGAAEVRAFEDTCADLAPASDAVKPPSHVRDKLLARLAAEREVPDAASAEPQRRANLQGNAAMFLTVFAGEGEWHESPPGVFTKKLFADAAKGSVTSLVRMSPGASAPEHLHQGVEECIVIEGDFHLNELVLGPGDYHRAEVGSSHRDIHTNNGTMLLLVTQEECAHAGQA